MKRLATRGPNARPAAKLPALQTLRAGAGVAELVKETEKLREWVEVRLGARGDPAERATTMRELAQQLEPIKALIDKLGDFDGSAETLDVEPVDALPSAVRVGAMIQFRDGRAFLGTAIGWREITLTAP